MRYILSLKTQISWKEKNFIKILTIRRLCGYIKMRWSRPHGKEIGSSHSKKTWIIRYKNPILIDIKILKLYKGKIDKTKK